jgi:hypothetical protein
MHPNGPVLIEGGHYTLADARVAAGDLVNLPGGQRYAAPMTPTTIRCFAEAARQVALLRATGTGAAVGLMVGDLGVPAGQRPPGGAWAIPETYRRVLTAHGLGTRDVHVWGEAYARNQGKRRILDESVRLHPSPRRTYERYGWALMVGEDGGIRLVSDASLDWDGAAKCAVLTRGDSPLCPLVFAGLRRAVMQAGFRTHVAVYALDDDGWIDVKLRAGAVAAAQLTRGSLPDQVLRVSFAEIPPREERWYARDLLCAGEAPWEEFLKMVLRVLPDSRPLDAQERAWRQARKASATATCSSSGSSPCSG